MQVLVWVVLVALLAAACAADGSLVWQMGKPDSDYAEFGIAGRFDKYTSDFADGVRFEVGGSADTDWPYIQPGPSDIWAGSTQHPHQIVFNLDSDPTGAYLLQIDLVDANSMIPPTMQVRVNDRTRRFSLERGASDRSLSDPSQGSEQTLSLYLPANVLRKGQNEVELTCIRGSWILYDCVFLTRTSKPTDPVDKLTVKSTLLFKEVESELKQVVEVGMTLYEDVESMRVLLESEKGWRVETVFSYLESGTVRLEIDIPPVEVEQKASLQFVVGDRTYKVDVTLHPEKRWKVYMMPGTHFDNGYTAVPEHALRVNRENMEKAVDWCAKYPGFGWNVESSLVAEDYIANGSKPEQFIELAKQGRIGIMGFYANFLTGLASAEELSHLLHYYDYLRHTYGIESNCVIQSDVPTMVATVPMILSGHGIKYMSCGLNLTRANWQDTFNQPFYWEAPDGSRVLVWKTGGYSQSAEITGLDDDGLIEFAVDKVSRVIDIHGSGDDSPIDALLLHGAYMDNCPIGSSLATVPEQWNRTYAYPKLIFCRGSEFFEYIESNFADKIPTVKGDGGVFWEDGAGSSARETAVVRAAKETLVTIEKLLSLCRPEFQKSRAADLREAWKNVLLYDEHTWGAHCSVSEPRSKETLDQWAAKKSFADRADSLAKRLRDQVFDQFCSGLQATEESVLVFNPSSWTRSEYVGFKGTDGRSRSVYAESVPPLGYKLIPVQKSAPLEIKPGSGETLENKYYTIRFDKATGAVSSIYDKDLKRELVDNSKYGLNAALHVTGGEGTALHNPRGTEPELSIHQSSKPRFKKQTQAGAQVMRVTAESREVLGTVTSEVILHNDCKRIDFVNNLDKKSVLTKEAAYFAFPFAFEKPQIRIEVAGGVVRPEVDQIPGGCRDWYCAQHFVTLSDDTAAVAWTSVDSPLFTLQDINRGQWRKNLDITNGDLFAYVFNNYWWTNYRAEQEGPHCFRFSLTSARSIDDVQAKRFGEEIHNPMMSKAIAPGITPALPSHSFASVREENVVIQAVSPARFSGGVVIRLREMSGRDTEAGLVVDGIEYKRAYLCNLAEDKQDELIQKDGVIRVPCRGYGLAGVLLER